MAEFLEGKTDHATFAPLSHAQTLQISRHLQDQITQLNGQLQEVTRGLRHATDGVQHVRDSLGETNLNVQALQDGARDTNASVDATRKELGRTNSVVQKLQAGLETSNEGINSLREGQKMANASLQRLGQDLARTTTLANSLQDALQKRVIIDIGELRDELSKTNLHVNNLRTDQDETKAALAEEKENIRANNLATQGVRDDLNKTNTVVHILETRLADTSGSLKATRQSFEDLNNVVLKMHEEAERTKVQVSHALSGMSDVAGHTKDVHDHLNQAVLGLSTAETKLDNAVKALDTTRQGLQQTQAEVKSQGDAQDVAKKQLAVLTERLQDVAVTALQVKAGLNETNSLVLPNLDLSRGCGSGSSQPGSPLSRIQGRAEQQGGSARSKNNVGSPLPPLVQATAMNSTAQNRLAWI